MKKINCKGCKHYFITFDVNAPYGCKAYGFKGKVVPSILVSQVSGSKKPLKFLPKPIEYFLTLFESKTISINFL